MAIAVRSSRIAYANNVSSTAFAFPTGSLAGDRCVIFVEHGFAVTLPTDWFSLNNSTGSNVNGACFEKVLDSADITAGSVTISFGGTFFGVVAGISFVGAIGAVRTSIFGRNSAGSTSRTLTTDSSPQTGDYAAYFASGRGNVTVTSSSGAALQTTSNVSASGVLTGGLLGASGAISSTFSFSSAPTGDYYAIVVFSETLPSNARVSQVAVEALSDGAAAARVSQVAVEALSAGAAAARISQVAVEALRDLQSLVRVSQVAVEALSAGEAAARISQVAIEALSDGAAAVRISQLAVEVLHATGGGGGRRRMSLM